VFCHIDIDVMQLPLALLNQGEVTSSAQNAESISMERPRVQGTALRIDFFFFSKAVINNCHFSEILYYVS